MLTNHVSCSQRTCCLGLQGGLSAAALPSWRECCGPSLPHWQGGPGTDWQQTDPQTADSLRTTTCAATSDSALLPACQRHLATLLLSHPGCNLPCPPLWEQWTTPPDGSIRSSRPQWATCRTKARSNFKRRQCSWLTRTMAFAAGAEVDTGSGAQLLGAMVLSSKCHVVCGWRLWHEGA